MIETHRLVYLLTWYVNNIEITNTPLHVKQGNDP